MHGTDWLREQGFGGVLAVGGGSARRRGSSRRVASARRRRRRARRPRRQGHHLRHRRAEHQARRRHEDDEDRHGRRRGSACGAALVAAAKTPVRVTALVPAAENSFGASSYRPGDVVRHVGGRTSEIANTDAEGRIVLADALAYAAARLRPTVLVDVATLTGAMKVALGLRTAGFFATTDELAGAAGRGRRGDRRAGVAAAAARRVRATARLRRRRREQLAGQSGRDHGRAVPAALHRRAAVGASRHRRAGPGGQGRRHAARRARPGSAPGCSPAGSRSLA